MRKQARKKKATKALSKTKPIAKKKKKAARAAKPTRVASSRSAGNSPLNVPKDLRDAITAASKADGITWKAKGIEFLRNAVRPA